jgi:CheY-like chemotaxis protein
MARVRLIHWNGPEGRERKSRLTSLGFEAEYDDFEFPHLVRRARADPPDAYLIDLSRLPSHGREVALSLRGSKATRHIPIVFVDGDPEKVAKLKTLLPDATYTSWGRLKTALPKAIQRPVRAPIIPPPSIYSGKPTVEKLGIKPGMRVSLVGGPKGIAETLGPLPKGVTLTAKTAATCDIFLVFVRSLRELVAQLDVLGRDVTKQPVWLIWPKTASGVRTDLNGNIVRETGLAAGWVDYKVCSVDATWSGLAFKRRV